MPKTLRIHMLFGLAGAIAAGVALSRFTHGDWIGGTVLAAAASGLCARYLLAERRPRDSRRY